MNYILVVDDEEDIRDIYEMVLSRSFPLDVVGASSGQEALGIIEARGNPEIIISDLRMSNGDGVFLWQRVSKNYPGVPFVISSTDPVDTLKEKFPQIYGYIEKPMMLDSVIDLVNSVVAKYEHAPDFVPIRISVIKRWGTTQIDFFMKLSDSKFIKVINSNEAFITSDADRFLSKGLNFLYINKTDVDTYLDKLQKNILMVTYSDNKSEDLAIFTLESFEAVERIAHALGWSPSVLESAKKVVDLAINLVIAEPNILKMLQHRLKNPASNYSYHATVIALLSCGFCQLLGWTSESTQMKLGIASLLHDLALDEKIYEDVHAWNQAAINQNDRSTEVIKYRNHPLEAANLLLTMKSAPPDVDQIILQHHEMKDGSGFPRGLDFSRITPMASVFIIIEDLVDFLSHSGSIEEGVAEFLKIREGKYDGGSFKKVFNVLKTSATS